MVSFRSTFTFFVGLSVFASTGLATPVKRQCAATLTIATNVGKRLQSHYFNSGNGQYTGGSLWTDANTLEDLHNLMLAANSNDFSTVADTSFIGRAALNSGTNWQSILGGSNDDAGWIILALWKIADYKSARGLNATPYKNAATTIYNIVVGQWDSGTCGGGVWWSTAHTYKNAITNQLFLLTSAEGFRRTGDGAFKNNANLVWNWMKNSGMRNAQGLWNDGLTSSCANNGQTTWTYNQGVIASGLASLAIINNDKSLLAEAEITLDATVKLLSTNNILKESCDNAASGGAVCNQDQQIFKGLWTKHLQYYLDLANDSARTSKYSGFLGSQSSAVFHYGTNADNDVGSVWYAPNQGGSVFTPKTSASGLAAHIAAAKYAPC